MIYGPERLISDLNNLGYKSEPVSVNESNKFVVIHDYVVPLGQFAGRIIDLGIPAPPNFPQTVGASIHIKTNPQIFDYADSKPHVRNIVESALGDEWRYWSHNFNWTEERTARRLMSQINGIFKNA